MFWVFAPKGMWDLGFPSRDRTRTPYTARRSHNHWNVRDVLIFLPLLFFIRFLWCSWTQDPSFHVSVSSSSSSSTTSSFFHFPAPLPAYHGLTVSDTQCIILHFPGNNLPPPQSRASSLIITCSFPLPCNSSFWLSVSWGLAVRMVEVDLKSIESKNVRAVPGWGKH